MDVDLAVGDALADVVDEDAAPPSRPREFLLALEVGAECREMRALLHPRLVDDSSRGAGDDDVCPFDRRADVGRADEPEVRVARGLPGQEAVD